MTPSPVASADFPHTVLAAAAPVVVEFTAAWCAPCRTLAPVLHDLAERYSGRVAVAIVQVEDSPELAQAYRVTSMPTLLAFHGGQVVAQQVGYSGRRPVERLFEDLAARTAPTQAKDRTPRDALPSSR